MPKRQKDESSVEESNEEEIESLSAEESDEKPEKKTASKKRKKSTVKKAAPAYSFYMKERQQELKNENSELSFGEVSKKVSAEWKEMTEEQKKVFISL